jgi:alkylation response protein AidB-like acyl-CoA dehydrogenase
MSFAAQVLAVVGLGVARAALDTFIDMAGGRASITGAPKLADRAYVQTEIAQAEATLRSARAFFYEAIDDAYATLVAGETLSVEKDNLLRLSSTHLAKVGVDVAQTAYRLAGTTAIFQNHPIARNFNDALVVAQHAFLSSGTWQSAGRIMLGLERAPGFP